MEQSVAIGEVSEAKHPYRVVCRAVFAGAGVLVLAGVATGCSASGGGPTASGRTTARPGAAAAAQPGATATASPVTSSAASSRRAILAPATVPPVSDECTEQLITDADGNVSPLLCSGGGVNTLAWKHYATGWTKSGFNPGGYSDTLGLGPSATAYDVDSAMCYDFRNTYGTRPITVAGEELAQAYYGWTFTAADNPVEDFETGGCSASGTGTNVDAVLVPATVHPLVKECSEQVSNTQDGNITPLFCANDRLNAQAWEWYANFFAGDSPDHPRSELLTLGRGASQAQAYQAMCQDEARVRWTGQETQHAGELAYAYYGWTFSQNSLDRQFENGCPAG
jgi:hypothetical protein